MGVTRWSTVGALEVGLDPSHEVPQASHGLLSLRKRDGRATSRLENRWFPLPVANCSFPVFTNFASTGVMRHRLFY